MSVDAELRGDRSDQRNETVVDVNSCESSLCARDAFAQTIGLGLPRFDERLRIVVERHATMDDLDALFDVVLRSNERVQAEAIEQLRPELALLRVAASDER